MKTYLVLAGSVVLAASLAACSPSIHGKLGYSVDFQNGELVAHASGLPDATITADGSLRIGDRAIDTTPQQRALLKDYYGESKGLIDAGVAIGKAGVELGAHAVGAAIDGLFSGTSKAAEQKANEAQQSIEAQSNAIDATAQRLCSNLNQLRSTQQAIAAQLPAFKPYQPIDRQVQCSVTTTRTITVTDGPRGSSKGSETEAQVAAH